MMQYDTGDAVDHTDDFEKYLAISSSQLKANVVGPDAWF